MSSKTSSKTCLVVMGVSGCGKTSVGEKLAAGLGSDWKFIDGDDLHPQCNKNKMSLGHPLNDRDRWPWLLAIADVLRGQEGNPTDSSGSGKDGVVVACSALKRSYRNVLNVGANVVFVWINGSFELIRARLQKRENHFMKSGMLQSQFEALEAPSSEEEGLMVIEVDAIDPVEDIVNHLVKRLKSMNRFPCTTCIEPQQQKLRREQLQEEKQENYVAEAEAEAAAAAEV